MGDDDWYKPYSDRPAAPPRQPKPGAEVWRLRDSSRRVQSCELRDNLRTGAGFEVQIIEQGDILVTRQCPDEHSARYAAEVCRQDLARTGWSAIERGGAK